MAQTVTDHKAYFARAIDLIVIDEDSRGTIARVPASGDDCDPYTVTVDESGKVPCATDCTCAHHTYRGAYCKHMEVTDLYFARIAAIFAHDEEEVTPLEKRTGTVSHAEAVSVMEQYCSELDAYERVGDPRKETTVEESLPAFVKMAMDGGSRNGRFSGRA